MVGFNINAYFFVVVVIVVVNVYRLRERNKRGEEREREHKFLNYNKYTIESRVQIFRQTHTHTDN